VPETIQQTMHTLETGKTSKIVSIYMTGGENGEKLKRKDETNILFTESQLLF
jgi:hypothetical protein